jgi:hypothetical protein
VSQPVVVTDTDEVSCCEGFELMHAGTGHVPWPATPPPRPRPGSAGERT